METGLNQAQDNQIIRKRYISGKVSRIRGRTDFSPNGILMQAQKATDELATAEPIEAALLELCKNTAEKSFRHY